VGYTKRRGSAAGVSAARVCAGPEGLVEEDHGDVRASSDGVVWYVPEVLSVDDSSFDGFEGQTSVNVWALVDQFDHVPI
jgi:hypothetical protein